MHVVYVSVQSLIGSQLMEKNFSKKLLSLGP